MDIAKIVVLSYDRIGRSRLNGPNHQKVSCCESVPAASTCVLWAGYVGAESNEGSFVLRVLAGLCEKKPHTLYNPPIYIPMYPYMSPISPVRGTQELAEASCGETRR